MSGSKFGYPDISKRNTNEQNMQNVNAFLAEFSEMISGYMEQIEERISILEAAKVSEKDS